MKNNIIVQNNKMKIIDEESICKENSRKNSTQKQSPNISITSIKEVTNDFSDFHTKLSGREN